jgi:hypothetical protein
LIPAVSFTNFILLVLYSLPLLRPTICSPRRTYKSVGPNTLRPLTEPSTTSYILVSTPGQQLPAQHCNHVLSTCRTVFGMQMPLLHTRYRPLRIIWSPRPFYPAANDTRRLSLLSTREPRRPVRITAQLLRQRLPQWLLKLKELSMNNRVYYNEFSLSTTDSVQVRRLGHLPDLAQPITALLSVGRAFSLHLWCSLVSYRLLITLRGYQNVAEDLVMRHDSSSRPCPWASQTFAICSSDRAFVDNQKEKKKHIISHFRWRLIIVFFIAGGLFWYHFIFTWLRTSQGIQHGVTFLVQHLLRASRHF